MCMHVCMCACVYACACVCICASACVAVPTPTSAEKTRAVSENGGLAEDSGITKAAAHLVVDTSTLGLGPEEAVLVETSAADQRGLCLALMAS